ncbi:MAG: abortive infection family protein [Rhodocyclaceae bacterium]|nr:abortive infection family protein [Rhodocyclaceae bacterium]
MNNDLINKVESLKVMLVSRATGGEGDDLHYKNLRRELIALPRIGKLIPQVVQISRDLSEFWGFIKPKFATYAERREYLRKEFDPLLKTLEAESRTPSDAAISATIQAASLSHIQEAWQKALERRATDPEGAITAARTLLESVCKHVLDSTREDYDDGAELPKLYALTAKQLNLSPSQHTEQLFKQVLGGCQTVVEGLGAMRNRHSDAHGKGAAGTKPASRHAELAVNLAGAMATFLLQTWEARKK